MNLGKGKESTRLDLVVGIFAGNRMQGTVSWAACRIDIDDRVFDVETELRR